jgi:hypothetical protein
MSDPVVEALEVCIRAGLSPMLWGPPGVGKSDRVKELAQRMGWGLVDVRLARRNPVDMRGVPVPDHSRGRTRYYPPAEYPDPERDGERGIWFLDELTGAPRDVQLAALQLFLERRFDEYEVPEGWVVIAAGNRVVDRAGSYQMTSSLANRMVHIPVCCDLPGLDVSGEGVKMDADGWKMWAYSHGIREEVIAFVGFRPELLWKATGQVAFATPRTWHFVSRVLEVAPDPPQLVVEGCVGSGPAREFRAFLRARNEMPDPDAILAGADVPAPPPDRPDVLWALCGALVSRLVAMRKKRSKRFEHAVAAYAEWLRRVPGEFQAYYLKEAGNAGLITELGVQPFFREFVAENSEVFRHELARSV